MTEIHLTEEQQQIIAHERGPALVLAVAGAGKTLTMERRIARLVADGVFAPSRILATTFNVSAARELQTRIRQYPGCENFSVHTLHALGFMITRRSQELGHHSYLLPDAFNDIANASRKILYEAIRTARSRNVNYKKQLTGLDYDDFLTYVGLCKGQLRYADSGMYAHLPLATRSIVSVAKPPSQNPWYLNLYRLYEEVRLSSGRFTFDDQILIGWESLASIADVRSFFQGSYDCVVVDEFQDVNRAQAEMLHLLVEPHGNYMVVGDDDQTIYTWRGADPSYIRNFRERYAAKRYFLTENFRCPAPQVALANEVIKHNQQREPKRLQLTQGFGGEAHFSKPGSHPEMAKRIVAAIQNATDDAYKYRDIALLVRVYAQTGPIEAAFIDAEIPYQIIGAKCFYERPEITVLIDYCRLAFLEQLLVDGTPLTAGQRELLRSSWNMIYNHPTRYISRQEADRIIEHVLASGHALAPTLLEFSALAAPATGKRLEDLAKVIEWLAAPRRTGSTATETAYVALKNLVERLEYYDDLRQRSEFSGPEEVENVQAFITYALRKGTLQTYLKEIRTMNLHAENLESSEAGDEEPIDQVSILSMHRAKGLEWPIVIVPDCNEDVIPHKRAITADQIEEERRLLYVAITRSKQHLFMYTVNTKLKRPSSFLIAANVEGLFAEVSRVKAASGKRPEDWTDDERYACHRAMKMYGFDRYLIQKVGLSDVTLFEMKELSSSNPISDLTAKDASLRNLGIGESVRSSRITKLRTKLRRYMNAN